LHARGGSGATKTVASWVLLEGGALVCCDDALELFSGCVPAPTNGTGDVNIDMGNNVGNFLDAKRK
jgi:hypothetical protein